MYQFQELPKWKYRKTGESVIVDDKFAEDELGEGWFDTAEQATADQQGEAETPVKASRDDLIKQADALKIKVDKRWSDERLADEIAKASKA